MWYNNPTTRSAISPAERGAPDEGSKNKARKRDDFNLPWDSESAFGGRRTFLSGRREQKSPSPDTGIAVRVSQMEGSVTDTVWGISAEIQRGQERADSFVESVSGDSYPKRRPESRDSGCGRFEGIPGRGGSLFHMGGGRRNSQSPSSTF